MQYRFSYFQRRSITEDSQRRSGIMQNRAISIQRSVDSRGTGYATRVQWKAMEKKRECRDLSAPAEMKIPNAAR